jgi:hypothetical protein
MAANGCTGSVEARTPIGTAIECPVVTLATNHENSNPPIKVIAAAPIVREFSEHAKYIITQKSQRMKGI